jgi:2-polyprenyl-3-methyl-5-hydroxy-6-metoxy-1,4-benzoquinol methylase
MSQDFRKELFDRYNSTFKIHISNFDQSSINKMWNDYDYKYYPLISSYSKESPILELGCGRGYMLEYLKKLGFTNLKGIDISEEQVKISAAKGFNVEVADALNFINFSRKKYKIILGLDFIEHFKKEELLVLSRKIFDCLEEGGIFLFHTPNGQTILSADMIYGDLTHLTILTPNSAQQLFRAAGFSDISFFESGPVPKNLFGVVRSILWKLIKLAYNCIRLVESGNTQKILSQNFIAVAKK